MAAPVTSMPGAAAKLRSSVTVISSSAFFRVPGLGQGFCAPASVAAVPVLSGQGGPGLDGRGALRFLMKSQTYCPHILRPRFCCAVQVDARQLVGVHVRDANGAVAEHVAVAVQVVPPAL